MQQAVETIQSPLERSLTVAVPVAQIEAETATRLKELARTVKMQGFRPGKVPLKMVERHYGFQVRQEVLTERVQQSFADAVRDQNYRVAGYPRFEPVQAGTGANDVEFKAIFEVYPEIALGDLGTHKVVRPVTVVEEADVDATIATLRKQRAPYERVERSARDADLVNVDFEGRVDGELFDGGSAKNFTVVLGEGRMLPDFEAALRGMKEGEAKTFALTFPDDYQEKLKGKTAEFNVTVNQVAEPRLPEVDAEFAKALGVEDGDVTRMRGEIRQNVEREVKKRIAARLKEQVMEGLLGAGTLEVPRALLDGEVARMREAAMAEFKERGMSTDQLQLPADLFAERAGRRVKLMLLISDLVRRNNLDARPEQVRKVIEEHAESFEQPAEMVRWYYAEPGRLDEVRAVVMEDNVVEWALGRMAVADEQTPFATLMGTRKA